MGERTGFFKKRLPFLLWALWLLLGAPGPAYGAPKETPAKILQFIKNLEVIRIGITPGPNNGHQGAGAHVLQRLRQLGFHGRAEIVYRFSENSEKEKMAFLFPPFNAHGPDTQRFPELGLVLTSHQDFKENQNEFPWVAVGIMGADDKSYRLNDLRVDSLLKLQPYKWKEVRAAKNMIFRRGAPPINLNRKLLDKGYVYTPSSPKQMMELSTTPPLAKRVLEMLPSVHFIPTYFHSNNKHPMNILVLTDALISAAKSSPRLSGKPIIVANFNYIWPGRRDNLHDFFAASGQQLDWNEKAHFISIDDADALHRISEAKPGEIYVVSFNYVRPDLFQTFMAQASPFAVVAGMNTIDLMRSTGTPYLPSHQKELYSFDTKSLGPTAQLLEAAPEAFFFWKDEWAMPTGVPVSLKDTAKVWVKMWSGLGSQDPLKQNLLSCIDRSVAKDPLLLQAFSSHQIDVTDWREDKLLLGLNELIKSVPSCAKLLTPHSKKS